MARLLKRSSQLDLRTIGSMIANLIAG
jgi:hypothetical protein